MATSIPISGLNTLNVVSSSDFIPLVQSSSLTTFKTTLSSLSNWISSSVAASSSISSISASYAKSASISISGSFAQTSNNLIYPNTSTASYALKAQISVSASFASQSISSSNAVSASWAPFTAVTAVASSSWSSQSFQSVSASWAPVPVSSSWASSSLSSSFLKGTATGSNSTGVSFFGTASNCLTASYVLPTAGALAIKAYANFIIPANFTNTPPNNTVNILSSGNIATIVINYGIINTWMNGNYYYFTVTFSNALSNNNYFTIGNAGERGGGGIEGYTFEAPPNFSGDQSNPITIPFKTTTSFVFSLASNGADRSGGENTFVQFVVYGT